jgi:putative colanic acid biosynthesis acetyltransferase WcaF
MDLSRYDNSHFHRGAPDWKEALWWVARSLFFECWFPLPSGLRCTVLRAFGARIGRGVVIRSHVNITFPWRFEAGDHVWIGDDVLILSLDSVRLGSNVCISQRAFLCTGSHDHKSVGFDLVTRPLVVEDECWIAAGAFLGPGVTVHRNTVVGAGAVVIHDVGPDALVTGNPAISRPRHTS